MLNIRFSLLFLAFIFFQCSIADQESEHAETEPDTTEDIPDTTTVDKTDDILRVKEFLDMPFTLSVRGSGDWESTKEIKPNMHHPDKKDTLIKLMYDHSEVQLLNGMYLNATIQDDEILLAKQLYVGMSREEFEKSFDNLKQNDDRPYISVSKKKVVMSCCKDLDQNPVWTFGFEKDTLQIILFDNYLD